MTSSFAEHAATRGQFLSVCHVLGTVRLRLALIMCGASNLGCDFVLRWLVEGEWVTLDKRTMMQAEMAALAA